MLKSIDSVMVSGILGHSIDEELEARTGGMKQEEGSAITWAS